MKVVICEGKDIIKRTENALKELSPSLPKVNSKILIKPNLVEPMKKDSGAVTRPELLEGIIKFLDDNKYKILIGESSAGYYTDKCFEKAGYRYLTENYNVELINFDDFEFVTIKLNGELWKNIEVTKFILKTDYLISAVPLKEHAFEVTLTLKNMMGILKPKGSYPNKSFMHKEDSYEIWTQRMCDILKKIKPNLGVIDGTTGMYGSHLYGKLKEFDITIVGEDPVAVDCVGAKILGYDKVFYIDKAIQMKIGNKPTLVKKIKVGVNRYD
ncbi:MAG: DUF362 domain-containing protein [Candidatus Aenigmatarchaeota archaeon]